MKVLVIDSYYGEFLVDFYRRHDLLELDYAAQRARLFDAKLGTADVYSRQLAALGVEAEELISNCVPLQLTWAREQGLAGWRRFAPIALRSRLVQHAIASSGALAAITAAQVRHARPDVLYLQDLWLLSPKRLAELRPYVRLIVGQCGSAPPPNDRLKPLDLVLTSFPHFVDRFRRLGIPCEYFRLGFDPSVLARVGEQRRQYTCTFVGGFSRAHATTVPFLEHLADRAGVEFFGYGRESLAPGSAIRPRHRGEAWGLDMYRVLAQSQITVNRHGAIAQRYANNMRLYEATGMGAMLLTDKKDNLGQLFSIGSEVVAYESAEEAAELIRYYADHPAEREQIARAGQQRTLREHTYARRMEELRSLLEARLRDRV